MTEIAKRIQKDNGQAPGALTVFLGVTAGTRMLYVTELDIK